MTALTTPIGQIEDRLAELVRNPKRPTSQKSGARGGSFQRLWTKGIEGNPLDHVEYEARTAVIRDGDGKVLFEQTDVETPKEWSQMATDIVVSKYFRGTHGAPDRETSVRQLIHRVAGTIAEWGAQDGYWVDADSAIGFYHELCYILVHQIAAFNSPVWFNVGFEENPQCSACFICSVDDSMRSIMQLAGVEADIFKGGSGAGSNLSHLRSSKEGLRGGGTASGPVSFMRGYDAFAGVIRSGGKTRRAAKMTLLNDDHPDILEFIDCKQLEEKKAWALIEQGYDPDFNGEAYGSVFFQNANLSVRASDAFMEAAVAGEKWPLRAVHTDEGTGVRAGDVLEEVSASEMLDRIAEGTHICGDPGMQFDDTINHWNPVNERQRASNPCSEFLFPDNTACNLASINLLVFRTPDGGFDVVAYRSTARTMITAQEIIVDRSSYPTTLIGERSHELRPLGLGYANLGALLMSYGMPYDSEEGRGVAAAVTSLLTGEAYAMSGEWAEAIGPFPAYEESRERFTAVMEQHQQAAVNLLDRVAKSELRVPRGLLEAGVNAWSRVVESAKGAGIRNGQATVLAPTGTISFMMDCDTTGIEPDLALVKYKRLVGRGLLKIVNQTVPLALEQLGYDEKARAAILEYIDDQETIEGAPGLKDQHLPVFDCAFKPKNGQRSIHWKGHLAMVGAAQPFLSGAASKTINCPADATVQDIREAYVDAWKMGIKCVAIYREGSKRTAPLSTSRDDGAPKPRSGDAKKPGPVRERLPHTRPSITHKFQIGGHEGYLTVGMYPDSRPGEIFVKMAKEGSVVSGLIDAFATATSIMLQYGVPLEVILRKFKSARFEPSGITGNPEIPTATSVLDYIMRWLELRFAAPTDAASDTAEVVLPTNALNPNDTEKLDMARVKDLIENGGDRPGVPADLAAVQIDSAGKPCHGCGGLMVRVGGCWFCFRCYASGGCG